MCGVGVSVLSRMSEEANGNNRMTRYPPIKLYHYDLLDVSDGHEIYYEEYRNSEGNLVIFL